MAATGTGTKQGPQGAFASSRGPVLVVASVMLLQLSASGLALRGWAVPLQPSRGFRQRTSQDSATLRLLRPATGHRPVRPLVRAVAEESTESRASSSETPKVGRVAAFATAVGLGLRRLFTHRIRQPVLKAQSPMAEIAIAATIYGTVCTAVRGWAAARDSFALRDDLFQELATAKTYQNSLVPWLQSGVIAIIASFFVILGVRAFIKSMKNWEQRQEMKEMSQMGEDALFLMSTPVDATPLEKKKERMRKRLVPLPMRILGKLADTLWMFRVGACVGYLLPFLNALDFGEISISLFPYAVGVPPCEPIVNFMQNTLGMKYLYNAYLKSGYYFLIVWFIYIQLAVRNKAMPFFLRFHSSQAILISMLLGVPQQVFFAVLNPWESGLVVQTIMYHSMVSIFLFIMGLLIWCCINALLKRQMTMPLVSEAAVMWAGRE